MIINKNGQLIEDFKACISIYDRIFLYADGVFDTLTVMHGEVLWFDDYFARLEKSAELTFIKLPFNQAELDVLLKELIAVNNLTNCKVRINISRGDCPQPITGYAISGYEPNYYLIPYPLKLPSKESVTAGIRVVTVQMERIVPEVKTICHLPSVLAYILGKQKDAAMQDVIMLTRDGFATESGNGNLFIIKDSKIITPKDRVLHGIGRKIAIKLARDSGYEVLEQNITLAELLAADEVFLSASGKGVVPVASVDGQDYKLGAITKILIEKFQEQMQ